MTSFLSLSLSLSFTGCASPIQEALQQFESAPGSALEQISLLDEKDREIAVMTVMRSQANTKYCSLLSEGKVKDRCIRMGEYALQHKNLPKTSIQELQTVECSLHKDADTCWDLQATQFIFEKKFNQIKSLCTRISLSHWQEECLENKAVQIAQQGEIHLGFSMCNEQKSCDQQVLLGLAHFSVQHILSQNSKEKKQIQRNRDFISQQRKHIITKLSKKSPIKAYPYGETFLFYVTEIIQNEHRNLTSSLPIESILIKNCNQATNTLAYNKWDLENLAEWQQQYMSFLSKHQKKHTPRTFVDKEIPTPNTENLVAYAPFILRSAIPEDPLADWTLCLLEGVARLQNVDTRLLYEARSYPNKIVQNRANELITYLKTSKPNNVPTER